MLKEATVYMYQIGNFIFYMSRIGNHFFFSFLKNAAGESDENLKFDLTEKKLHLARTLMPRMMG